MSLNDSKIRKFKPSSRPVKLSDSHGLYLLVNPGGSRIWYLKYRFNGKESRVSLGAYPLVSLAEARQQRDGIRKLLAQNINPAQQRMAEKARLAALNGAFADAALDERVGGVDVPTKLRGQDLCDLLGGGVAALPKHVHHLQLRVKQFHIHGKTSLINKTLVVLLLR